jgi:hypothetical protein
VYLSRLLLPPVLRLFLVCAVLMAGGLVAWRVVLRPAEAAPEAVVTPAEATARTSSQPAADEAEDTLLYLRPGEPAGLTRTRGPLTLTLDDAAGPADADAIEGRWHLRFALSGASPVTRTVSGYAITGLSLVQLDADARYEALVLTYTGGAHCCTTFHVYDEADGAWRADSVEAGSFTFDVRDLDGDGAAELVSEDPRFEYAFGSFAGSRGASRIVALRDGRLREATTAPRFRAALEAHRDRLRADLPEADGDPDAQRGILAALVAQHALLDDAPAGYTFAAEAYAYPDKPEFLRTLRAFLVENGFVTRDQARALRAR